MIALLRLTWRALGPGRSFVGLALIFVSAILELVSVLLLRYFLLLVLTPSVSGTFGAATLQLVFGKAPELPLVAAALLAFFAAKSVASAFIWRELLGLLAKQQAQLATNLFASYLWLGVTGLSRFPRAQLQYNLHTVSADLFHELLFPVVLLLSDSIVAVVIFAALFALAPFPTVIVGVWLATATFLFQRLSRTKSEQSGRERRRNLDQLIRLSSNSFGDMISVTLMARERFLTSLYRKYANRHATALQIDRLFHLAPRFLMEILIIGALAAILFASGHSHNAEVTRTLTLFAAATMRLLPALQRAMSIGHSLRVHGPDVSAIRANLLTPSTILPPRPRGPLPEPFLDRIELQEVSFSYAETNEVVLRNLSFLVKRGEAVVVTGKSGEGKTTLLNVVLGLLEPTQGEILIDGRTEPPLPIMRVSSVAYVPQSIFLLDGTIAENVAFDQIGDEVDRARVEHLLRQLGLDERTRADGLGLDAPVGEDGYKLSGGQRQRVAIARALYSRPAFLVFDEATSQLDAETEARLYRTIRSELPGSTVLAVTHRPVPEGFFDRTLVLRAGRLS